MKIFQTKNLIFMAIVLISIMGGVLAVYSTANGPWGYSDPVAYISTAHSLDNGQGLGYYEAYAKFTAYTIQPPFYSIVLSILGLFHINLVVVARWLNIFAFVVSIFMAGWIFIRFCREQVFGIIASLMMCAFPYMIVMFSSAYSEPLFILIFLSGGVCLLYYLQRERFFILLLSGLLFGSLPLTRYVGIAMIVSAGLSILLFSSGKAWPRIKKASLFVIFSCLPILLWLGWVYLSTAHSIGGRSLVFNLGELASKFQAFRGIFMDTIWKWVPFQSSKTLLRYSVRFILLGLGFVILLSLSFLAERQLRRKFEEGEINSGMHIFAIFGMSSLTILTVLIATYLFTYPTIDIDNRTLLPLYVSTVISLVGGIALWQSAWFKGRMRILQAIPWVFAAICVVWYIPQTQQEITFYHSGDGLTAYHWDRADIIQAVRALPADQPVISNNWELLLLWTGRPIHGFWTTYPPELPSPVAMYGNDPRDSAQTVFCKQGAALVIFSDFPAQFEAHFGKEFVNHWSDLFNGLTVFGQYLDGTIYHCP